MKAKDLKSLIENIPDEDEVGWTSYYDGDNQLEKSFTVPILYRHKYNNDKVWVITAINSNIVVDHVAVKDEQEIQQIVSSFPDKKYWFISVTNETSANVYFNVNGFNRSFQFFSRTANLSYSGFYIYENGKVRPIKFTTWEYFFKVTEQIIKNEIEEKYQQASALKDIIS